MATFAASIEHTKTKSASASEAQSFPDPLTVPLDPAGGSAPRLSLWAHTTVLAWGHPPQMLWARTATNCIDISNLAVRVFTNTLYASFHM